VPDLPSPPLPGPRGTSGRRTDVNDSVGQLISRYEIECIAPAGGIEVANRPRGLRRSYATLRAGRTNPTPVSPHPNASPFCPGQAIGGEPWAFRALSGRARVRNIGTSDIAALHSGCNRHPEGRLRSCGRYGSRGLARPRFSRSRKPPIPNRGLAKCGFASKRAGSILPTSSAAWVFIRTCHHSGRAGYEVAGRVDAAAAGLDVNWIGRDVVAMTRFGYADAVCVPAKQVFARPSGMSALEAAAIPVNYFTAWQLIVVMGGLKRNETVLVHSAGGVGIAATQIAKHLGGRVIGTASAGKHAELRALGIDHLIDYRTEDFEMRSREITDGRGVDLILDPVGGESWRKGYRMLAPTGRLGAYGLSAAATQKQRSLLATLGVIARIPWFQFNPLALMGANKGVFGVNLSHMWGEIDRIREWADRLFDLWTQGVVKPKIAQTFQFAEVVQAHRLIQDRRNSGKVLLVP